MKKEHPNPDKWWNNILWQSWFSLISLIILGVSLAVFKPEIGLVYTVIAGGLSGSALSYSGGTALANFARAWRGNE